MDMQLSKKQLVDNQKIIITGSKSETNRLLLLQALFPTISIENESNSDDTSLMQSGLAISQGIVDVSHAGTAMRFLTAFFAVSEGKNVILTGSERMKQRPVAILVNALRELGSDIEYLEKEGFPPLKINGKRIVKNEVSVQANVSSQFISALLLIGASLSNGLRINVLGKITSLSYLKMTLSLLQKIGIKTSFTNGIIEIFPTQFIEKQTLIVESDWSSASYFYSLIALSPVGTQITLSAYNKESLQGDSILTDIYTFFGVKTTFENHHIILYKEKECVLKNFTYNFINTPDIAQTIAITCIGLGINCEFSGLHTLKIKETNRLEALKIELSKLGAQVYITDEKIKIIPFQIVENVKIDTYNDHRMAMAFAPLSLCVPIVINDADVVSKSYPNFWIDFNRIMVDI